MTKKKIETGKRNLAIQIDPGLHRELKVAAAHIGESLAEFVERVLKDYVARENAPPKYGTMPAWVSAQISSQWVHDAQAQAAAAAAQGYAYTQQGTNLEDIARIQQIAHIQALQHQAQADLAGLGSNTQVALGAQLNAQGNVGGQGLGANMPEESHAPTPALVDVTDEELFEDFGVVRDDTAKVQCR